MTSPCVWPEVRLSDLLTRIKRREEVKSEKTYELLGAHWYATGLYTKAVKSGLEIRAKYLYRVKEGDFVYNRLFAWKGSFAVASAENHGCYVSNEFPCFRIDGNRLDSQFLWYFLSRQEAWLQALGLSYGATPTSRNRLKEKDLLSLSLPLPPLTEQRRIVARIQTLAAKVAAAQRLRENAIANINRLLPSLMHEYYELHLCSLGELGDCVVEMCNGLSRRPSGKASGPVVLRLADVSKGVVSLKDPRRGDLSEVEKGKYRLSEGDLLFVRVNGSPGIIGRCIPVPMLPAIVCYNDHLIRVRLNPDTADYRYIWLISRSPQVRKYLKATAITTAGQMTVNQKMLKKIPVPLPPIPEQRRIVAHLDALQAKLTAIQAHQTATQTRLDALLPAILDRAFQGEL